MRTDLATAQPGLRERADARAAEAPAAQGLEALEDCGSRPACRLALYAGGLYYRSHQQTKRLTDKDTPSSSPIFDNKTGDPIFDDTLKTALNVSLRQSPFLSVLSDQQVAEILKLMTRPADTKLTPAVTPRALPAGGKQGLHCGNDWQSRQRNMCWG